jgi:hypothetical protein
VKLSTLNFALNSTLFDNGRPSKGETLSRKDLKVRFNKRSYDEQTHRSYEPDREYDIPDVHAMRHVEAGNAAFVVEDEQPAQASQESPKQRKTQKTPPGAEAPTEK